MMKPQHAILRFAKYKGPEIANIEAHNERTKDKYASNPDIDPSRSHLNFHLIEPKHRYRAEAERQIKEAGCRTRSDSVRLVEALVTQCQKQGGGDWKTAGSVYPGGGADAHYLEEVSGSIHENHQGKQEAEK